MYSIRNIKYIGILFIALIGTLTASNVSGLMPEVVVTAERPAYNEVAMMPEVLVTAPRYNENEAMMDEVVVTASKEKANVKKQMLKSPEKISYDDIAYNIPAAYQPFQNQLFEIELGDNNIDPKFALAKVKVSIDKDKIRVAKLIIPVDDTVKEDIEFSGTSGQINGVLEGDLALVGGSLEITETGKITGDIAVLGGELTNAGLIKSDVAILGGDFHNKTFVDGDIFVAGGTVKLDSGSVVDGSISIIGGSLERDTHAIVKGEIKSVEIKVLGKALPKIKGLIRMPKLFPRTLTLSASAIATIASILGLFVLALILLLIFPKPIEKIAEKTQVNIWIAIAIGFGLQILIVPLIVLLAVSIIGIAVIPLFLIALLACLLLGITSVYYLIGSRIKHTEGDKQSLIGKFALGFIVIMAIPLLGAIIRIVSPVGGFFTVLGSIILYVIATVGLGAAFYTLVSRKKQ
jgi:hypothetical protein